MSTEHEAAIDAILQAAGVEMTTRYLGEKAEALGGKHAMDEWQVTFKKARPYQPAHAIGAHLGPVVEHFEYFTGFGCRETVRGFKAINMPRAQYTKGHWQATKPKAPRAAGVLYSLILDSSAAEQTFESWCGDYGYDTDSRKALATYLACQDNADKLGRIFDRATRAALSEALEGY